jgi:hypothetical protein
LNQTPHLFAFVQKMNVPVSVEEFVAVYISDTSSFLDPDCVAVLKSLGLVSFSTRKLLEGALALKQKKALQQNKRERGAFPSESDLICLCSLIFIWCFPPAPELSGVVHSG